MKHTISHWASLPALLLAPMLAPGADQAQPDAKATFTYQNPIDFSYPYFDGIRERTITELRDPAIIREGDTYYLVFTHFPFTHHTSRDPNKVDYNSSPGIRLYSSKDLKTWKFENWLVKSSELPENCPYKHRYWAPEIHKFGNRFYVIFYADNWIKDEYNSDGKMGYVAFVGVADRVTGPYEHISWLKGGGCDTTLFGDTDGKTYAIMPFGNEYLQEADLTGIDKGNIKLVGERKMIVSRDNSDVGKTTSPAYLEGPWMIKHNGKYICFTAAPYPGKRRGAAASTNAVADLASGYWVGAAAADNIWGPYKKNPQVFLGGHINTFTGPDGKEWYSYRGESGGKAQGRLCIDPVQFNEDGSIQPSKPSAEPITLKQLK
jgi:beta-xylosidase